MSYKLQHDTFSTLKSFYKTTQSVMGWAIFMLFVFYAMIATGFDAGFWAFLR